MTNVIEKGSKQQFISQYDPSTYALNFDDDGSQELNNGELNSTNFHLETSHLNDKSYAVFHVKVQRFLNFSSSHSAGRTR